MRAHTYQDPRIPLSRTFEKRGSSSIWSLRLVALVRKGPRPAILTPLAFIVKVGCLLEVGKVYICHTYILNMACLIVRVRLPATLRSVVHRHHLLPSRATEQGSNAGVKVQFVSRGLYIDVDVLTVSVKAFMKLHKMFVIIKRSGTRYTSVPERLNIVISWTPQLPVNTFI